jgi:hypothetical protein
MSFHLYHAALAQGMTSSCSSEAAVISAKSGRTPQHVMERYKMQLAVEMLRSVRSRNVSPAPANLHQVEPWSFEKLYNNALEVSYLHHDKGR